MTNGRLKARGRAPRQGGQAIRRALGVLRTLAIGGEKGVPLAEIVQATCGGIHIQNIAIEVFDEDRVRRAFEDHPEGLLPNLKIVFLQPGFHARIIVACRFTVNLANTWRKRRC